MSTTSTTTVNRFTASETTPDWPTPGTFRVVDTTTGRTVLVCWTRSSAEEQAEQYNRLEAQR